MRSTRRPEKIKKYEDFAYVLDFLPEGYPSDPHSRHLREPIIQSIGETFFTLLELSVKRNTDFQLHDRIKIGRGDREVVNHVKSRLRASDLTFTAKTELPNVLKTILDKQDYVAHYRRTKKGAIRRLLRFKQTIRHIGPTKKNN